MRDEILVMLKDVGRSILLVLLVVLVVVAVHWVSDLDRIVIDSHPRAERAQREIQVIGAAVEEFMAANDDRVPGTLAEVVASGI